MKVTGIIELTDMERRTPSKAKVEADEKAKAEGQTVGPKEREYILVLKVTDIDGKKIASVDDTFNAVAIPELKCKETVFDKSKFKTYSVLPGMQRVTHLSLVYNNYFNEGLKLNDDGTISINPTGSLVESRLANARKYVGQTITFDAGIPEFVVTDDMQNHVASFSSLAETDDEDASPLATITGAKTVGKGRDTVLNLIPDAAGQKALAEITAAVCGMPYITTAQGTKLHYHTTIGEASLNSEFRKTLGLPEPTPQTAGAGVFNSYGNPAANNNSNNNNNFKRGLEDGTSASVRAKSTI